MKPWLHLPASFSHSAGPWFLRQYSKSINVKDTLVTPFTRQGITFKNPFGTAGGLDKKGADLFTWYKWGVGFIEVGTLTPKPQKPNPGKILDRSNKHQALWNSMGFPNAGYEAVKPKIIDYKNKISDTPLFINIGKNRDTPLEEAHKDYVKGVNTFGDEADAFVVNISSPNTANLRKLHEEENFKAFISPIAEANEGLSKPKPLLIKVSPDLPSDDLKDFVHLCQKYPLGGWILSNTTNTRFDSNTFPSHGGLSGAPLSELSTEKLKVVLDARKETPDKLVISVGGIMDPTEALKRLDLGADLVEFYSGLIFYGPGLFKACAQKLKQRLT